MNFGCVGVLPRNARVAVRTPPLQREKMVLGLNDRVAIVAVSSQGLGRAVAMGPGMKAELEWFSLIKPGGVGMFFRGNLTK